MVCDHLNSVYSVVKEESANDDGYEFAKKCLDCGFLSKDDRPKLITGLKRK